MIDDQTLKNSFKMMNEAIKESTIENVNIDTDNKQINIEVKGNNEGSLIKMVYRITYEDITQIDGSWEVEN